MLFAAACTSSETGWTTDGPTQPGGATGGTVIRVIDGDSIVVDVDGETIELRMLGINTSERDECHSDRALDFLVEEIGHAAINIETVATDQFGRALGYVWHDDEMINLTLVSNGLAIAQTADDDNPYAAVFLEAESIAYESGTGMWSSTACGSEAGLPDIRIDLEKSSVDPPGPDGDHLGDEFVIIVNRENQAVDLSGWTLRDESSRNRLVFPNGTKIMAGQYLKVVSGCGEVPSWCSDTPIWNNDGDMAMLLDENGTVVARARY